MSNPNAASSSGENIGASATVTPLPTNSNGRDPINSGQNTIPTAQQVIEMIQQKKEELVQAAFDKLGDILLASLSKEIKLGIEGDLYKHISNNLFNKKPLSISLVKKSINNLQNEFFAQLNTNINNYFEKTPEIESEEYKINTKAQLMQDKAGIQRVVEEVLGKIKENGYEIKHVINGNSGFLESLTISTPIPTTETVKKSIWQQAMKILNIKFKSPF